MASENGSYRGLLVDYGGVLTSNLFDSFRSFCELEGLDPEEVGRRFRNDPAARELLIGLETGKLPEDQFEEQLGQNLGVPGVGLIDRLFAGSGPEPAMVEAVRRARGLG
ncbi:MAG: putative hydrolase of the superfamily, partial [Solirubrobacteraceae bacterium]|nr:putative hydrolase of the superfamily [Solirubrobacteraceae bacterium]